MEKKIRGLDRETSMLGHGIEIGNRRRRDCKICRSQLT